MDPTGTITPTVRIQPLTPYQGGNRQHHPAFTQGQLLQGVVSEKNGPNRFTIDIGGRQVLAESTAQLQIGQKLNLQVAALTPQVELHIVTGNAVNRMIGNSIHLISQQSEHFPVLADLAEISGQVPQLSSNSQKTLQFYADSIVVRPPLVPSPTQQTQLTSQLLEKAVEAFAAPQSPTIGTTFEAIASLLQQLAQTASSPSKTIEGANRLADFFSQAASLQSSAGMPLQAGTEAISPLPTTDTLPLLDQLGKIFRNDPQGQNLINQLTPLLRESTAGPLTQPLQQLLSILVEFGDTSAPPQSVQVGGQQLQEIVERLGINMDQLLADNGREKAVQTLKHALIELSQQLPPGDKSSAQADQIVKSIELYHLLQVRLAGEALLFMPLPFSFLDQGYLLVDADSAKNESKEDRASADKLEHHVELHLQLEGLGYLQIDFQKNTDGITLKFLAEDTERAKFLAGFRNELETWLTAAQLESVQFLTGAQEPVKALLKKIMAGATGIIDTNA